MVFGIFTSLPKVKSQYYGLLFCVYSQMCLLTVELRINIRHFMEHTADKSRVYYSNKRLKWKFAI